MADLNNTIVRGKLRVTEDINTNGNIAGSSIIGSGSGLTNLNASNISSGTLSADRHYSPTADSEAELTAKISGTAGAYAKDTEYTVLTGVKAQRDAKGHVTGLTYTAQKIKDTNTDTNTSHNHSAGVGLVGSGSAGTSGTYTYKAKLRSETALTVDSAAATTTSGRVYPVAVDKSGYLSVNVPWSSVTIDASLSSSSTNPPQNKAVYSAFSSAVGYDYDYYKYGSAGSWRMYQYNTAVNSLDIRYGLINITSQSASYDVSFTKDFNSNDYTIVFGLYRWSEQGRFWLPIVQSKTNSGFKVFVQGNTSVDNDGKLMYLAIRSN